MTSSNHKNVKLVVAYDGTHFLGFQKTKEGRSVEAELEAAVATIVQHPIQIQAASRTDRGVHATHQVVHFFTQKASLDLGKFLVSINQLLPEDIRVISVAFVDTHFHPTIHAIAKEYHYTIFMGKTHLPTLRFTHWHIHEKLNLHAMQEAAKLVVGTHDFAAFCNTRKDLSYEDTIRTLTQCDIIQENNILRIILKGDRFLYKMARNIVGTLVYVGLGKLSVTDISKILEQKNRIYAGITAPAHGLTLVKIYYNEDQHDHTFHSAS
jgi:tRNA pseudouridine38-40 synthase